jgi:YbbR domain-containing protein
MLNEENPVTHKTVEAKIAVLGVERGLARELDSRTVKVTLRGLEQDMADLKGEVHAAVSCRGLAAGTYRLTVRVQPPENLTVVALRPASVSVALEKIVSERKAVEVKLVGEPIGGFEVTSADFSPKQVQVSGARSRVERTARVVVTADLARMVPGVPVSIAGHALDGSGAPVEGVEITPARVHVTAVTERVVVTQTLPVVPRTQGALPRGLRLVSVQVDPPMITLVLPATRAGEVTRIETEPLNLSNVRGNASRALKLVVPPGASLADDERVVVTLRVEPIPTTPPASAP